LAQGAAGIGLFLLYLGLVDATNGSSRLRNDRLRPISRKVSKPRTAA
jgi:lantibiotic modifying enzyme